MRLTKMGFFNLPVQHQHQGHQLAHKHQASSHAHQGAGRHLVNFFQMIRKYHQTFPFLIVAPMLKVDLERRFGSFRVNT